MKYREKVIDINDFNKYLFVHLLVILYSFITFINFIFR